MASLYNSRRNLSKPVTSFPGQISPPYSPPRSKPIVIPPFWDSSVSLEQNVKQLAEENRLQILESRQQMAEIRSMLSDMLRSITAAQGQIRNLEDSVREANKEHVQPYSFSREETMTRSTSRFAMTWTLPKRPISLANCNVPLSPTPTDLNEPSYENPDLELKWDVPVWLGEDIIEHPYRGRIPLATDDSNLTFTSDNATGVYETQENLHILPIDHNPEEFVHSPFGRVGVESQLSPERQKHLAIRRIDTEESTMGFISAECDRYPIPLGGLYEPIIWGRFPDEPDTRRAFVFRTRRWGVKPGLLLHRLPRRELLLPNDSLETPDDILKKRHRTWYLTYRVWYRFVSNVGPSRFPGLLDRSWELILESTPEEARAKFSEILCQYMGYAGTSISSIDARGTELDSIIPDLLLSFDEAVKSPWSCHKPLTDLIIDLDEFESQRALEVRDSTRLWRGILWNTFPKHCMKHIRLSSVGGSDSLWEVVHAEFAERLKKRQGLWNSMGKYRFPQGSYVPDATSRCFDRVQRLRQLVHESAIFANILLSWKDGALHLKHSVIPHFDTLTQKDGSLDDHHLQQWSELCKQLQQFYEWRCGLDAPAQNPAGYAILSVNESTDRPSSHMAEP